MEITKEWTCIAHVSPTEVMMIQRKTSTPPLPLILLLRIQIMLCHQLLMDESEMYCFIGANKW